VRRVGSDRRGGVLRAGSRAVVTGGSSGLGEAIAGELAARGRTVTLVARRAGPLEEAAARLRARHPGVPIDVAAVDVTDPRQVQDLVGPAADRPLDVLVNCAGILREGRFEELSPADFREVMAVNLHGTVDVVRAALPALRRSRGRIVNVASIAGLTGVFGYTSYASSKHALVGFTDSLRYELGPQGIRVHLVCPGEFTSPMVEALEQGRTPENRAHTLMIPASTADAIARDVVRGVDRDRDRIVPGRRAAAAVHAQRWAPRTSTLLARRVIARAGRTDG
jgi:3-dehydrosphinganine reductase